MTLYKKIQILSCATKINLFSFFPFSKPLAIPLLPLFEITLSFIYKHSLSLINNCNHPAIDRYRHKGTCRLRVCPEISVANFGVEATVRQGARRANTIRIQPTSNTAGQEGSAPKCSNYFRTNPKPFYDHRVKNKTRHLL